MAKRTRSSPSPTGTRSSSAPFETANRSSVTTRVTEKTALNAGSSKHGKARRACVDSNCVTARVRSTCSPVASSVEVNVER